MAPIDTSYSDRFILCVARNKGLTGINFFQGDMLLVSVVLVNIYIYEACV